jgi:TRAP-type uncharacterized transport system substrate-binding protein
VAQAIKEVYPEFSITVSESQGGIDQANRLRNGEVPLANSQFSTNYSSYLRQGEFRRAPRDD